MLLEFLIESYRGGHAKGFGQFEKIGKILLRSAKEEFYFVLFRLNAVMAA